MGKFITCRICEDEFDLYGSRKQTVGGYGNVCADCTEDGSAGENPDDSIARYRGVTSGDGKMQAISIVSFDSESDAKAYVKSWNASTGFGGRKSNKCNSIKFKHVGTNIGNSNHKGKS
jgi:hypothetical protein